MECRRLPECKMTHLSESREPSGMFDQLTLSAFCYVRIFIFYFFVEFMKYFLRIYMFFLTFQATVQPWT